MADMRRVFGTTGIPEEIPQLTTNQLPILDLSDAAVAETLLGRTVYVSLWIYVTGDTPATENVTPPTFWSSMTGSRPRQEFWIDDIPDPALYPMLYVMTSPENTLGEACAGDHIVAAEMAAYSPTGGASIDQLQPFSDTNVSCLQPSQILSNYPMTAGDCLYVIHNLDPATTNVFAWGYYVVQGFEGSQADRRPLQPDPTTVNTQYYPTLVQATHTEVVHSVSEDYTDEVTVDWRVCGYGGTPNTGGANRASIIIENGPTIPLYIGMTVDNTYPGFSAASRFFDGIPMKGAGAISFELSAGPGAIQVTGSFKRY